MILNTQSISSGVCFGALEVSTSAFLDKWYKPLGTPPLPGKQTKPDQKTLH